MVSGLASLLGSDWQLHSALVQWAVALWCYTVAAPGQGAPGQPPWHASAPPWLSPWQPEKTKKYCEQFLIKNNFLFTKLFSHFIIIFYFVNIACFHAKLGSYVCPRVDNQTSGDTLQDLTQPHVEKSPYRPGIHAPMGIGASFWWRDAFHCSTPTNSD